MKNRKEGSRFKNASKDVMPTILQQEWKFERNLLFLLSCGIGIFPDFSCKARSFRIPSRVFGILLFAVLSVFHRIYYVLYSGNPWLKKSFNSQMFLFQSSLETSVVMFNAAANVMQRTEYTLLLRELCPDGNSFTIPRDVSRISTVYTITCITWLIFYQIGYGCSINLGPHIAINLTIVLQNQIMIHLIGLQFCFFLFLLSDKYNILTSRLTIGQEYFSGDSTSYKTSCDLLCLPMVEQHVHLGSIARLLNRLYRLQLLALFSLLTLYFIGWLYYILTDLTNGFYMGATFRVLFCAWIIAYLFVIVNSCHMTRTSVSCPLLIYSTLRCAGALAASTHGYITHSDYIMACDFCGIFSNPYFSSAIIAFTYHFRMVAMLICLLRVGLSGRDFYLNMFPKMSVVDSEINPAFPKSVAAHAPILLVSCIITHANRSHLLLLLLDRLDHFSMYCLVAQYGTLVELLTQHFANRIHKLQLPSTNTNQTTDSKQNHQIRQLRQIEEWLAEILTLCSNINEGLGLHVLLSISYFAYYFLMDTFFTYGVLRAGYKLESLSVALPAFLAIVLIFKVCHVCELFYSQVNPYLPYTSVSPQREIWWFQTMRCQSWKS